MPSTCSATRVDPTEQHSGPAQGFPASPSGLGGSLERLKKRFDSDAPIRDSSPSRFVDEDRLVLRLSVLCVAAAAIVASASVQAGDFELLEIDGRNVKWGPPEFASGADVSFSYVRSIMQFPSARNCRTMTPAKVMAMGSGMPFEAFDAAVKGAFAQWSRAADIVFRYVDDPAEADILLGTQATGHGIAFTNVVPSDTVSHGEEPAVATLEQATICFNPSLAWNAGQWHEGLGRDFRTVAGHEIGHAIGLDHPGPRGAMMAFKEEFASRVLQPSDIEAVQTLYGRPDRSAK